jgi:hypothetical protein
MVQTARAQFHRAVRRRARPTTTVATTGLLDAAGTTSPTREETRPQNIYVNFLIEAEARIRVLDALRMQSLFKPKTEEEYFL